jgi:hypothetical protein
LNNQLVSEVVFVNLWRSLVGCCFFLFVVFAKTPVANGSLDTKFGKKGVLALDVYLAGGTEERVPKLIVFPDGSSVIAEFTFVTVLQDGPDKHELSGICLTRVTNKGNIDSKWNNRKKNCIEPYGQGYDGIEGFSFLPLKDYSLLIGYPDGLLRLDPRGVEQPSKTALFNQKDLCVRALKLLSNNTLLLLKCNNQFSNWFLNGEPINTFISPKNEAYIVQIMPHENGFLTLEAKQPKDPYNNDLETLTLKRFTASGITDTAFGTNGMIEISQICHPFHPQPAQISIMNQNRILVSWTDSVVIKYPEDPDSSYFATTITHRRYSAKGQIDLTFGKFGQLYTPPVAEDREGLHKLALAEGKRLLVNGQPFTIERWFENGQLDKTFAKNGSLETSYYFNVALTPQGLLLLKNSDEQFFLLRYALK